MEKLLPPPILQLPKDGEASLTGGKGEQDGPLRTPPPPPPPPPGLKSSLSEKQQQVELPSAGELNSAVAERLFVFRDPTEADRDQQIPKRPQKRNFLNLKKSSVAPADFP